MSRKKMRNRKNFSTNSSNAGFSKPAVVEKARETINTKRLERQKRFVKVYAEIGWKNMAAACKVAGVSRAAVMKWTEKYPNFARQIRMIDEAAIDAVECKMYQAAVDGNCKDRQMFIMRTKGRSRGYGEHQTIEADITHRIAQDRIDAIVRAHERVVTGNVKLPEGVLRHLEKARDGERTRLMIPEVMTEDQG